MKNLDVAQIFFYSSILLVCSYRMDTNKSHKTYLNSHKIIKYLSDDNAINSNSNMINYIKHDILKNNCLNGKVYYLTNKSDSECMILITKHKIYIVFIGTQFYFNDLYSLGKDLFTDVNFGLTPFEDFENFQFDKSIKIHNMYQKNMLCENLIYDIINILNHHNANSTHDIIICGHSMGCGLGLYSSIILSLKFPNVTFNLFTIESPKLGNAKLNKFLNKITNIKHFDLVNSHDIIFLFPFIYPNYTHISKNNKIFKLNSDGNLCLSKYNKINNHFFISISDHFINNVLLNLYTCLTSDKCC